MELTKDEAMYGKPPVGNPRRETPHEQAAWIGDGPMVAGQLDCDQVTATTEEDMRMALEQPADEEAYRRAYHDGKAEGYSQGEDAERKRVREELLAAFDPFGMDSDEMICGAGVFVDRLNRICPE